MPWPMSQDYNEAIQDPAGSFADAELKAGQPVTNALGMPMPRSGNFADVYEFESANGNKWALKCFTREVPGLHERYSEVSRCLAQAKLPFMVDFKYLEQGIRIQGRWYPLLKMQWVEGFLLNEFVRNNLDKPVLLDKLGQIWLRMGKRLREVGIAHADLQHGNVILVPGSRASALAVKLIDYDGMVVPALARKRSGELGHPAYQHPQRLQQGIYSAEVDRLPLLAIACALRALAVGGKALWQRYDNGDNMLFREVDLRQPGESALFKELWSIPDAAVHDLTGYVALGVMGPLAEVPVLHEVVIDNQPRPLTAAEDQQVTALLGPGAKVKRTAPIRRGQASTGQTESLERDPLDFDSSSLEQPSPSLIRGRKARQKKNRLRLALALGVGLAAVLGYFLFFHAPSKPGKKTDEVASTSKEKKDASGSDGISSEKDLERKRKRKKRKKSTIAKTGLAKRKAGWVSLFNGKDLTGWFVEGGNTRPWQVEHEVIVARGATWHTRNYLLTEREYGDFILRLEYNLDRGAGSGIGLRAVLGERLPWNGQHIPEHPLFKLVEIPRGEQTGTTHWVRDAIGVKPDQAAETLPPGEWNQLEIEVKGQSLRARINGKPVLDTTLAPDARLAGGALPALNRPKGRIGLQKHTGTVRFHKIEIKELLANETAAEDEKDFVPLFNGEDFTGWKGLTKQFWSIQDDAIVGSTYPDGSRITTYLCTKQEYKDFELRFQAKLNGRGWPGNSGVNVRSWIINPTQFLVAGPQCDICPNQWGALYGENFGGILKHVDPQRVNPLSKKDEFNNYSIKCIGKHITITFNGVTTVDDDFEGIPNRGIIGLQLCGGRPMEIIFKDIRIKKLKGPQTAKKSKPPQPEPEDNKDFVRLLSGKDLMGWHLDGPQSTKISFTDGVLAAQNLGPRDWVDHLVTNRTDYTDFHFRCQFKLNAVRRFAEFMIRVDPSSVAFGGMRGYLVRLWGEAAANGKRFGVTSLALASRMRPVFELAKGTHEVLASDDWHRLEVRAVGRRLQIFLNGKQVIDHRDEGRTFSRGAVALQFLPETRCAFCNLALRELEPKPDLEAPEDNRTRWVHKALVPNPSNERWSVFQQGKGKEWIETGCHHPTGFLRFRFTEVERTADFVEIERPAGNGKVVVRLYENHLDVGGSRDQLRFWGPGGWQDPLPAKILDGADEVVRKAEQVLRGHNGRLTAVAFASNGKNLISASNSLTRVPAKTGDHVSHTNDLGSDNSVRYWDLATGEQSFALTRDLGQTTQGPIVGFALSPDKKSIAIASFSPRANSSEATVTVWDLADQKRRRIFPLTTGDGEGAVEFTDTGKPVQVLPPGVRVVGRPWFRPDGKSLFVICSDRTVNILGLGKGTAVKRIKPKRNFPDNPVRCLCLTRERKFVLAGTAGGGIEVWSIKGGLLKELKGHSAPVQTLSLSPDQKTLVSASLDGTARLWDLTKYQELKRFEHDGHPVLAAVFAGSAKRIITGIRNNVAVLWDVKTGQPHCRFEGHEDAVTCLAVSADGKLLATGSNDCTARIWKIPK